MSTDDGTFGQREKSFHRQKITNTKNNILDDGRPWWLTKVGKRWAVSAEGRVPGCRWTGIGKVICGCAVEEG